MQVEQIEKTTPKHVKLVGYRYPEEVEVVLLSKEGRYVLKTLDFEVVWTRDKEKVDEYIEEEPPSDAKDILARTVSGSLKRVRSILKKTEEHAPHHVSFKQEPVEEVFENDTPYELTEKHTVSPAAPQILDRPVEGEQEGSELSASLDEIHGLDRTCVKIWLKPQGDGADGNLEGSLNGHTDVANKVFYDRKSKGFVTASKDGTAKVWSADYECIATLNGHSGGATAAAVSPDGSYIVTGDNDGTVRIWSRASWTCIHTFQPSPEPVSYIGVSSTNCIAARCAHTLFLWFYPSSK